MKSLINKRLINGFEISKKEYFTTYSTDIRRVLLSNSSTGSQNLKNNYFNDGLYIINNYIKSSIDSKGSRLIPILSFIDETENKIKPTFKKSKIFNESEIIIDKKFDLNGVKISSNLFSNNSPNVNNIKKQYPDFHDKYYVNDEMFKPDLIWVKKNNNIRFLVKHNSGFCDLSQEYIKCLDDIYNKIRDEFMNNLNVNYKYALACKKNNKNFTITQFKCLFKTNRF